MCCGIFKSFWRRRRHRCPHCPCHRFAETTDRAGRFPAGGREDRHRRNLHRAPGDDSAGDLPRSVATTTRRGRSLRTIDLFPATVLYFPSKVATLKGAVIRSGPLQHRPDGFHLGGTLRFSIRPLQISSR